MAPGHVWQLMKIKWSINFWDNDPCTFSLAAVDGDHTDIKDTKKDDAGHNHFRHNEYNVGESPVVSHISGTVPLLKINLNNKQATGERSREIIESVQGNGWRGGG